MKFGLKPAWGIYSSIGSSIVEETIFSKDSGLVIGEGCFYESFYPIG
jgi:hypothetical protein